MPVERRPPMPRLPPFALAAPGKRRNHGLYLFLFFLFFAAPLFAIHLPILDLPFFWDEQGQFIPTALDIFRHGWWIAHSTIPNVHPPGVEAYLALWYKAFGFAIPITRVAMLVVAGAGLLATFLLAIELSRGTRGAPAFLPPLLLLASPLFFTQSMMAQLDMPAMVFTLLALLLFLKRQYALSALASIVLVLLKETGIVAPFVFFLILAFQKRWRRAALFVLPAIALLAWLVVLHRATGYWLGNPGFAHYNVEYSLNPVRMALSFARRIYYLFFAEFRWIGTIAILYAARRFGAFRDAAWRVTIAVAALTVVLVSVLGGAELERYLLPVLPIFYTAVAVSFTFLRRWIAIGATTALAAGLVVSFFWNPPYPFPYENNLAMVDFVRLEQAAAGFAQRNLQNRIIATAWPLSGALKDPDYGYVQHPLKVIEAHDFHPSTIRALPHDRYDALITYTRTWAPDEGVVAIPVVRWFLIRYYDWQPEITPEDCWALGLTEAASWQRHGLQTTIYIRREVP
ncbi:MAG TPA: glycosyltransferase 87 family protein [Bryobacteraceae bacterium]|jgi:hypothetical protein|nr:glycosyltransferase 87 family protein [Bryobacteraceae bacterium]